MVVTPQVLEQTRAEAPVPAQRDDRPHPDAAGRAFAKDGVTYRADVAGEKLVAAKVGDRGESELTLRFEAPSSRVTQFYECYSADRNRTFVRISVNGETAGYAECTSARMYPFEPYPAPFGPLRAGTGDRALEAGQEVVLRAWLENGAGERVDDPRARLLLGVYDASAATSTVAPGVRVPRYVDGYWLTSRPGDRFALVDSQVVTLEPGQTSVSTARTVDRETYVRVEALDATGRVQLRIDGRGVEWSSRHSDHYRRVRPGGRTFALRADPAASGPARAMLLVYERER